MIGKEELPTSQHVPELYRSRAQATAGLVVTGAAGLAAAVVFGGASYLTRSGKYFAVAAIVLLLTSVVLYIAAANWVDTSYVGSGEAEQRIQDLVSRIRRLTRLASLAAISALISLVGVVWTTVLTAQGDVPVTLVLSDEGLSDLSKVCPLLTNSEVPVRLLGDVPQTQESTVRVVIEAGVCKAETLDILLPFSSIDAMSFN